MGLTGQVRFVYASANVQLGNLLQSYPGEVDLITVQVIPSLWHEACCLLGRVAGCEHAFTGIPGKALWLLLVKSSKLLSATAGFAACVT